MEICTRECHLVALPYPGRGHINPMINLCNLILSQHDHILITFVVTEEWLGFLNSDPLLHKKGFRFRTIPNVIPSEMVRANDMKEFFEALSTKVEAPFEQLLNELDQPPSVIMADTFLFWAVGVGNRRNIPVASFFPMSATVFSMLHHVDLLHKNGHFLADMLERGQERVDYIPGVSSTRVMDMPSFINGSNLYMLSKTRELLSWVPKAQYLIFPSLHELEPQTLDALKAEFSFPVYAIGPAIPYFKLEEEANTKRKVVIDHYFTWLDCQPSLSVLYISMGSFLSFSSAQMDEIAAGLQSSGVRFLWVARHETLRLKGFCGGESRDRGLIVPWCDQLKVLCHPSVGGFWTHCGWNSIREGIFAGVPFLTFPIVADQRPNSKLVVEDWKIGWSVEEEESGVKSLVRREGIAALVKKFMESENEEGKELRRRVKELQGKCHEVVSRDGSSAMNINAFVKDICFGHSSSPCAGRTTVNQN